MAEELTQICPHCQYPREAGHSKTCPTRKSEEKEDREQGYELFVKFLEKHGIDKMTKEEKVAKIKELDFDEVMQTISRINGRLGFRDKKQEWSGKAAGSVVASAVGVNLEPPANAEEELKKVFADFKDSVTVENMGKWSVKIYMAVIFSHAFENGNGRTARVLYNILNRDGIPKQKIIQERNMRALKVTDAVSLHAMTRVFEQRGIVGFKDDVKKLNPYGIEEFVFTGNMGYLKFLAGKKILEEDGLYKEGQTFIDIDEFKGERSLRYKKEYEIVKKEWFQQMMNFCDDRNGDVKQYLDDLLNE